MTRAFVTGGSGFVGGALVDRLLADGDDVRALARSTDSAQVLADAGATVAMGNLFDESALANAMSDCDVVFHVAGVNTLCPRDAGELYRTNVGGPSAAVQAAAVAGVTRVVVTSSVAGIGASPGVVADETTSSSGVFPSHYARSKNEGERAALAAGERLGVEVIAVLPSSVQGPARTEGSARLFTYAVRKRNPVIINSSVSIVDIEDCVAGHVAAAELGEPGGRYILSGATIELRRLVELIATVTGWERRSLQVPRWAAALLGIPAAQLAAWVRSDGPLCPEVVRTMARDHRYDGGRATRELGVHYTPIEETIERVVSAVAGRR